MNATARDGPAAPVHASSFDRLNRGLESVETGSSAKRLDLSVIATVRASPARPPIGATA
jgi:hypothetical protein